MSQGKVFSVGFSYTEVGVVDVYAPSKDVAMEIVRKRLEQVGADFGFDYSTKDRDYTTDFIDESEGGSFSLPKVVPSEKSNSTTKYLIQKNDDEYELASMERLIEYGRNFIEANLSDDLMPSQLIAKFHKGNIELEDAISAIEWANEDVTPIYPREGCSQNEI